MQVLLEQFALLDQFDLGQEEDNKEEDQHDGEDEDQADGGDQLQTGDADDDEMGSQAQSTGAARWTEVTSSERSAAGHFKRLPPAVVQDMASRLEKPAKLASAPKGKGNGKNKGNNSAQSDAVELHNTFEALKAVQDQPTGAASSPSSGPQPGGVEEARLDVLPDGQRL